MPQRDEDHDGRKPARSGASASSGAALRRRSTGRNPPARRASRPGPRGGASDTERRHWFYDCRVLVCGFCLAAFIVIFWQVSQFEGFQPIFSCAHTNDVDRQLLSLGMEACMSNARSQTDREGCMRTVYVLACMKERWR